jgi:hypothetical protein
VQHVVIHGADRNALVEAMSALVVGRNAPAAVDVIDWDADGAEPAAVTMPFFMSAVPRPRK